MNSEKKICKQCGKEFLIIEREGDFYKRKNLPFPEKCSECRKDRRRHLRNERKLYSRACAKCGVDLMSTYPPKGPYIIYCEKCYFEFLG